MFLGSLLGCQIGIFMKDMREFGMGFSNIQSIEKG
jgi:hypothetical protein